MPIQVIEQASFNGLLPPDVFPLAGLSGGSGLALPPGVLLQANAGLAAGSGLITPASVQAASAARFYSDPGVGNFYLGMSSPSRSSLATHISKMGGAPLGVLRHSSPSGAPDWTVIDTIRAGGRIPWTSFKATGGRTMASIVSGADDAWIDGIAAGFAARAPWPIWWTFWHEPENDTAVSGSNAPNYRAAQRRIAQRIKAAGVTNSVFAANCYQFPYSFGSASGRDWRIWYADWKGTTTSGGKFAPNPVDYWVAGDPNSVVELFAIDFYHQFEIQNNPSQPMSKWLDYTGSGMWTDRLQPYTQFLGHPYAIGEWSTSAAQDGLVFDPNGDGSFTLTEYNAQVNAGTINFYPETTTSWINDYFGNHSNDVVAFCYWDDSSTKTTSQVATNPLGVCDPDETRWQAIGAWGRSAFAKTWTG